MQTHNLWSYSNELSTTSEELIPSVNSEAGVCPRYVHLFLKYEL